MNRRRHVDAIAALAVAEVDAAHPKVGRRLLRPDVAWVARELDEELAGHLGVLELVERARDRHLAELGPDEGLCALTVTWTEIVIRVDRVLATGRRRTCSRCGARLARKRHRCSRCRLPIS